jgi:hypothetical protein
MTTLLHRVEAMAAVLDEHGPKDWRSQVDPQTLDFDSTEDCTLGQLYGSYHVGLEVLRAKGVEANYDWQLDHAVELSHEELGYGDYTDLTDAWKTYLRSAS